MGRWTDTPLTWSILPQDLAFVRVALEDWCVRERKRLEEHDAYLEASEEDAEDSVGPDMGEIYALQDEWARLQRCERMVAETKTLFPEGVSVSEAGVIFFSDQAAYDRLQEQAAGDLGLSGRTLRDAQRDLRNERAKASEPG